MKQARPVNIAVIADTHDRLPPGLIDSLRGADEIWHLGDVCDPSVLTEIEGCGAPVFVVRGNCDGQLAWPLTRRLERNGRSFLLIHIPPRSVPSGADAVLHGHTHVPRDEVVEGVRFLNPGCVTRPNRGAPPSTAWLRVSPSGEIEWSLHPLSAGR